MRNFERLFVGNRRLKDSGQPSAISGQPKADSRKLNADSFFSKNRKLKTGNFFFTLLAIALLLCCSAVILSLSKDASAQLAIDLRQTGQTTTYGTGDDASKMRGVAWPNPRFVDNGNGTVTDNLTGLIWLKNANCTETVGGVAKGTGFLTWANALTWSNNLANGNCDLTDDSTVNQWRLPTVNELQSLVNANQANIATWLNASGGFGNPFTSVQSGNYWSSSTYADGTGYAWFVSMYDGSVYGSVKVYSFYVWPVRAGQ